MKNLCMVLSFCFSFCSASLIVASSHQKVVASDRAELVERHRGLEKRLHDLELQKEALICDLKNLKFQADDKKIKSCDEQRNLQKGIAAAQASYHLLAAELTEILALKAKLPSID